MILENFAQMCVSMSSAFRSPPPQVSPRQKRKWNYYFLTSSSSPPPIFFDTQKKWFLLVSVLLSAWVMRVWILGNLKLILKSLEFHIFRRAEKIIFLKKHWNFNKKNHEVNRELCVAEEKKSRMQETPNISTNADRSIDNKRKLLWGGLKDGRTDVLR